MTHTQTVQLVQQQLLADNELAVADFNHALSLIGSHHIDYADIYCQRTAYESWHLEESMAYVQSAEIKLLLRMQTISMLRL